MSKQDLIISFCEGHAGADAVHVQALEGGLVTDITEFWKDHGDDRPRAVLEWANAARGDRLTLQALRRTGERCGGDDVWQPVGTPLDLQYDVLSRIG